MATRKQHSSVQIVRKLMAADRLLAEGKDTAAVSRELGVSEATYHRSRNQFGGLKAEDATPARPGAGVRTPPPTGRYRRWSVPGDRGRSCMCWLSPFKRAGTPLR
jgi:putative transposase